MKSGILQYKFPGWARYGISIFAAFIATFLHMVLLPFVGSTHTPLLISPFAVMVSAYFGGLWPGIVCTVLDGLASAYFFFPPEGFAVSDPRDQLRLVVFMIVGVLISLLAERLHQARHRAELNARELQNAKESAEAADRAKDRFLAMLSHELRTPLAPVLLTLDSCLQRHKVSIEKEEFEMLRRNVGLEVALIDDLLDLTRISRGKLHLKRQVIDAHQSLRHVIEICRPLIDSKRLFVEMELDAPRYWVDADPARLQQIFWNILTNAVKFTPDCGSILLQTRNDAEGSVLAVEVTDTGIGIDAEVLPRIFDAFEQGDGSITRQFGGMGLGLSISQKLAALHEGTITACSEGKGKGSIFTIQLPVVSPPSGKPARLELSEKDAGDRKLTMETKPMRVLLVEDHADTLRLMARLLKGMNCEVTAADTPLAALQVAGSETFDLVISDLGLPEMSGFELMEQLRDKHRLKGIALSGYGTDEDIRKSMAAGFSEHLVKPVNLQALKLAMLRVAGTISA